MPAKKIVPLRLFKAWQQVPKQCADMAEAKAEALRDHRWLTPMYLEATSIVLRTSQGDWTDCYAPSRQPFLLTVQPLVAREFYQWREEDEAMALEPRWQVLVKGDPGKDVRDALQRRAKAYVFARTYLAPRAADTTAGAKLHQEAAE